jgi:hypothetical protein
VLEVVLVLVASLAFGVGLTVLVVWLGRRDDDGRDDDDADYEDWWRD